LVGQAGLSTIAHEDDVKYYRWKLQYDQIPEDTKDPNLIRAKKQLKKKMPTRRQGETYWTKEQFQKLVIAPAANLASRGPLPWRLLATMLIEDPQVQPLRNLVGRRLLAPADLAKGQKDLNAMLVTLWTAGFLDLIPKPTIASEVQKTAPSKGKQSFEKEFFAGWLKSALPESDASDTATESDDDEKESSGNTTDEAATRGYDLENYRPERIDAKPRLELLCELRSVNPIYGLYLIQQMQFADPIERIQALESVLELPANISKLVPVPGPDQLPLGPLAQQHLHPRLLELGLAGVQELTGQMPDEEDSDEFDNAAVSRESGKWDRPAPRPLALGEKLRRMFDYDFPGVHDVYTRSVWVVGELLSFECDFNKYIVTRGLQKHEGMLFRHVLRFVLLVNEISCIAPEDSTPEDWEEPFDQLAERLMECCRRVDPDSTDELIQELTDRQNRIVHGRASSSES
jgi:hypothetical protein